MKRVRVAERDMCASPSRPSLSKRSNFLPAGKARGTILLATHVRVAAAVAAVAAPPLISADDIFRRTCAVCLSGAMSISRHHDVYGQCS